MREGAELEGLTEAPDTATDTVRQDLHLSLCLLSPPQCSQSSQPRPVDLPILQLIPGRIIDPNFLRGERRDE